MEMQVDILAAKEERGDKNQSAAFWTNTFCNLDKILEDFIARLKIRKKNGL